MDALGGIARQWLTPLLALFLLSFCGWAFYKFHALQSDVSIANDKVKTLESERATLVQSVATVEKSVHALEVARVADNAAVKSATDGAALAAKEARNARAKFDKVIANDKAARNFLDQRLPDSVRLYVYGSASGNSHENSDPNAARKPVSPLH